MSLKNRYNLWKLKQDFAPGKVFKAGLERSLSRAWNAKYGRPNWFQIGLLHKGAAFAVVVLLLIGSTGAYAYVSPEVTEGTAFYPLKQAHDPSNQNFFPSRRTSSNMPFNKALLLLSYIIKKYILTSKFRI